MSTRGFITFVAAGVEKTTYNHSDSYPGGLGTDVLAWLNGAVKDLPALREKVTALRVVSADTEPTEQDVEQLAPYTSLAVSTRSTKDWYCLLRHTQGEPGQMLQAGVIEDGGEFPRDSLFAEYGYVVDLDEQRFEAYEGFQKERHNKGRFADRPPTERPRRSSTPEYYPVALAASWPLSALPTTEDFLAALGEGE